MGVLEQLTPAPVFHYFEKICAIPHGSGNTEKLSDYLLDFARQRGLWSRRDETGNVVIFKSGTPGYEDHEAVILQGHLDMVCQKDPGCDHDFEADGLDLFVEGDWIGARGTSLGGDDGVAVAFGMALLDAKDIPHPPLYLVLTTDEEIGLLGATAMDCGDIKARQMINLDSEAEGVLLVSCAGGVHVNGHLPLERTAVKGTLMTLTVEGLKGGHSGEEINKGRASANQLMGRTLYTLSRTADFRLISVDGGDKDNAIPRACKARIIAAADAVPALAAAIEELKAIYRAELSMTDPGVTLHLTPEGTGQAMAMSPACTNHVIHALFTLPHGVQGMSPAIEGLVETSLNMGILKTEEDGLHYTFCVRSSVGSRKTELAEKLDSCTRLLGGTTDLTGDYPAWEYVENSSLRERMVAVYEQLYGTSPRVEALHAGLECGIFAGKIKGLDCISMGPDTLDIHTSRERLCISSTRRVWEYLLEVLKAL